MNGRHPCQGGSGVGRTVRVHGSRSRGAGPVGRLVRSQQGQDLVELTILIPLLLIFVFGIIEFGSLMDSQQAMTHLSREGANIASRGAPLDEVLTVTLDNGRELRLQERGGVVVSRILVYDEGPQVEEQVSSPGYAEASRMGGLGDPVGVIAEVDLDEGSNVYVVEIFYERPTITPLMAFFDGTIPEVMYDRAIF